VTCEKSDDIPHLIEQGFGETPTTAKASPGVKAHLDDGFEAVAQLQYGAQRALFRHRHVLVVIYHMLTRGDTYQPAGTRTMY
jgi:hypothetical protein